jgi:hypothetical protein
MLRRDVVRSHSGQPSAILGSLSAGNTAPSTKRGGWIDPRSLSRLARGLFAIPLTCPGSDRLTLDVEPQANLLFDHKDGVCAPETSINLKPYSVTFQKRAYLISINQDVNRVEFLGQFGDYQLHNNSHLLRSHVPRFARRDRGKRSNI